MVTTPSLTYQDYASLEGDERYELLDGELILVASPNRDHQTVSLRLASMMLSFVDENGLGWVFEAPFDVLFTDTDVVQPDVMFISREREHILTRANVQGAPDLIVEILSPSSSTRDWRAKRELYAAHGVREYWIIDPTNRIVSRHAASGRCAGDRADSYRRRHGDIYRSRRVQRQPGQHLRIRSHRSGLVKTADHPLPVRL